jgi:DNA-binding transcriptional LysR family regulator
VQIRYFLTAADHLNYARAANILGVYPSTLSRQVHHLEDNLGVSLFERHRHGIRLTAAGRQFFARAKRLVFDFERAVAGAARAGRAEVGNLCLGIASSILSGPLQKFVDRYRCERPDVDLRCVEGNDASLILALHERQIDVAVGYPDLLHNTGVTAMPLWQEQLPIALPEHHVLAKECSVSWSQFEHQTVLVRGWTTPPSAYNELARRMPHDMRITHHLAS